MFPIEYLAHTIKAKLYTTYSKFDYNLFQSYATRQPAEIDFQCQELPVKLSPLEILAHIPTFPDNQWATAYWLCEPVRLHS